RGVHARRASWLAVRRGWRNRAHATRGVLLRRPLRSGRNRARVLALHADHPNMSLEPQIRELFERANFAHLATTLRDGSLHTVPIWAGVENDRIVFFTQSASQKAKNLARDPRVAISVIDFEQ